MAKDQPKTRVVALAATKGGVGKTTLAAALSVRAAQDSRRVALIDADRQASLNMWWRARGEPASPALLELSCTAEGLELVIAEGWEWVFVDTPPAIIDDIFQAVSIADFIVIPVRPSAVDLRAIDQIQEICRELGKPFAFVLNQVEQRSPLATSAAKALAADGDLIDAPISYRRAYIAAMTAGRSGPEVERGGACAAEIDALWEALKGRVHKAMRSR
jgi:chromosome partitioning protein